jgi:S1-C subfamily serine protease
VTDTLQIGGSLHAAVGLVAHDAPGGLDPRGTAFTLGGRLMATALHVVGTDRPTVRVIITTPDAQGYQDTSPDRQYRFITAKVVEADPVHDLAILEMVGADAIAVHKLGGTDQVTPGTTAVTAGFPHADSGRCVLTQRVSEFGAKILIPHMGQKVKHVVLNTLLRHGESGGPVFSKQPGGQLVVVAVLTGAYVPEGAAGQIMLGNIDPQSLHQTTHAVSAEYLMEMMK